ncbi:hypothetical protein OPIT5_02565 [Opitutaceae bacterium TAV5]|nr:hypothetical protein OPIT5_02565 [Opitutaceae bacterium TAV5]
MLLRSSHRPRLFPPEKRQWNRLVDIVRNAAPPKMPPGILAALALFPLAGCTRAPSPTAPPMPPSFPAPPPASAASVPGFRQEIFPWILENCTWCHKPGTPSNAGIFLETHAQIKAAADDGSLIASILEPDPEKTMPPVARGLDPVPPAMLLQLQLWIDAGAPEN